MIKVNVVVVWGGGTKPLVFSHLRLVLPDLRDVSEGQALAGTALVSSASACVCVCVHAMFSMCVWEREHIRNESATFQVWTALTKVSYETIPYYACV